MIKDVRARQVCISQAPTQRQRALQAATASLYWRSAVAEWLAVQQPHRPQLLS